MAQPDISVDLVLHSRTEANRRAQAPGSVVEEASWGWAAQQCLEKTLKAWLHCTGVKPPATHDIARLLLLLEQVGVNTTDLLPLRAFTTFAVQVRDDDEPEELNLDRIWWCNRAEALINQMQKMSE